MFHSDMPENPIFLLHELSRSSRIGRPKTWMKCSCWKPDFMTKNSSEVQRPSLHNVIGNRSWLPQNLISSPRPFCQNASFWPFLQSSPPSLDLFLDCFHRKRFIRWGIMKPPPQYDLGKLQLSRFSSCFCPFPVIIPRHLSTPHSLQSRNMHKEQRTNNKNISLK